MPRHFKFNPDGMHFPSSDPFKAVVRSVAGMTNEKPHGLLTSLPSELAFNDMRDSCKRHTKQQKTAAHNLHSVACKSSMKRNMGCETVKVTTQEWGVPVPQKALKSSVFSALRQTDLSLGIAAEGLTRNKRSSLYTKPHKFCERLDLLQTLRQVHDSMPEQSDEDRRVACLNAFRDGWVSKLIPCHWLFAMEGQEEETNSLLVLRSGPHNILCIKVSKDDDGSMFLAEGKRTRPFTILVTDFPKVRVASTEAIVAGQPAQLGWKRSSDWMDIPNWLADFGILKTPQAMLSKVCTKLKLRGHTKLDHYHRVELFLHHMGKSEEMIAEILESLPKKKEKAHDQEPQQSLICFQVWFWNFKQQYSQE